MGIAESLIDHDAVEGEIARLRDLDLPGLRARWRTMFRRTAPDHLPRRLLFRVLAYRFQTERFGDLDKDIQRFLDRVASGAQAGGEIKTMDRHPSRNGLQPGRLYVNQAKFEAGKVLFPKGAPFLPTLEAELLTFPQGKTDDQVDSISQALSYQEGYDTTYSWVG
jgi:hypothetical protein